MKKLRVGIIGQGRSGYGIHAQHMRDLPKMFQIAAVVDPLKDRRDRAVAEFGCDAYGDYRPILARRDLDFVVNASPSHLHVPISLDLFKAGHNVLVEKPLARTVKEVDQMIAAAKKAKKLFTIYQQSRFAPYFLKAREIVSSGVLGRIVQISISFNGYARRWDWQTLTSWNGGNLMNTGPHPLDQALRWLDLPLNQTPEVFCHMDRAHFSGDAEGHVNLMLRAPNRPLVYIEISSCCAYPTFLYHVYGTQGGLKGTFNDFEWRYYKPSENPVRPATTKPIAKPDGSPAYCSEQLKWYEKKWTVPEKQRDLFKVIGTSYYRMLYKHFVHGGPIEVKPEEVRQQIAVIEECQRQNPHIWGKRSARKA